MTSTEDNFQNNEAENNEAEMNFEELFEGSVKNIKEKEVVTGTIVHISKDAVVVDIGYKTEGSISVREFLDSEGKLSVQVGDETSVYFEKGEDENGYLILSKEKANQMKIWDDIVEVSEADETISGTIVQRVKGGFYVDIKGVTAFLPSSQVDLKPIRNPDSIIGDVHDFKILKYNKRKNNVIVSRRVILEVEREKLRAVTLEKLQEGAVVEGLVKNITDYGAFIDLGGIDGLLHLTDMSWGKVNHPSQFLSVGDTVNVKILSFDKESGKISLGLKQTKEDPWLTVAKELLPGSKVQGKVVNITDYGAFVEIQEGLEGLIHISEMSWTKIRHPSQRLKPGDEVEVMVLDVDAAQKRISLGLKQVEANPWDDVESRYPVGSHVKGPVKNITSFGVFVGIEDGIDGLVHISDLSWKKVKYPSELFKKGDIVEAVVQSIDRDNRRFSLSTKELEKNPWEGVHERYSPGMIVDGVITSIADFGAFVELEEGLDGLVHVSELHRGKQAEGDLTVGDSVSVEVLNVDPAESKIGLSIREVLASAAPEPEAPAPAVEEAAPEEAAVEEVNTEEVNTEEATSPVATEEVEEPQAEAEVTEETPEVATDDNPEIEATATEAATENPETEATADEKSEKE